MKPSLAKGRQSVRSLVVDETRSISFMGDRGRIYSTPSMIRDIETTCRDLLLQFLDEGEDSVGVHVDVHHLAPAPLDTPIEITATIAEVDRRRVTFAVSVRDPVEELGRGIHSRFLVNIAESHRRVRSKIERLAALKSGA